MPNHKVFASHDEYIRFRAANNLKITQEINLTHDMVLVVFEMEDSDEARSANTSLATACFVTAHARLMLFDTMARIGLDKTVIHKEADGTEHSDYIYNGKLLYTDTDSVFYVSKNRLVDHGTHCGEWTDEVLTETGNPDARITKAVYVAPKCYAKWVQLLDGEPPIVYLKAKGVTLSRATTKDVTGDKMYKKVKKYLEDDVCLDKVKMSATQLNFQCITENKNPDKKRFVRTSETTKDINVTFGKRGILKGIKGKEGWTEPIGHCGHDYQQAYRDRNNKNNCKPYVYLE